MSNPPVQDQINALAARLALIDGQGLLPPAQGFISQTNANMAGLKMDIQQAVLTLEATVNSLSNSLQQINTQIDQLLGLSDITYTPVVVTPPTT